MPTDRPTANFVEQLNIDARTPRAEADRLLEKASLTDRALETSLWAIRYAAQTGIAGFVGERYLRKLNSRMYALFVFSFADARTTPEMIAHELQRRTRDEDFARDARVGPQPVALEQIERVYLTRWGTYRLQVNGEIAERIDAPDYTSLAVLADPHAADRWKQIHDFRLLHYYPTGTDQDSRSDYGMVFMPLLKEGEQSYTG